MYVCMYVCVYVCMCVRMYVCMYGMVFMYVMINSSKISIHRFIATTLFRVVEEWPLSGNIHE